MKKIRLKNLILFATIAALLCVTLLVPHGTQAEAADGVKLEAVFESQDITTGQMKLYNVFDRYKDIHFSARKKISKIRKLTDFAGNEYLLSEFAPVGYMILHAESGTIVERSEKDYSPYLGMHGNLIYGGPTYYYQEQDDVYTHTVLFEELETLTSEMIQDSNLKYAMHSQNTNYAVSDYLMSDMAAKATLDAGISPLAATVTTAQVTYPNFFKEMRNCGYMVVGNGVCGYIGANLMLSYFGSYNFYGPAGRNWTADYFLANEHKVTWANASAKTGAYLKVPLTNYLYSDIGLSLGKSAATISGDIRDVCVEYFSRRSITGINHTSLWTPFFTNGTVFDAVNRGWPVLIFGSLQDPSSDGKTSHAVTVYKAVKTTNILSSYELTANFGWSNGTARYNEVVVSGTLGSMYYFSW